MPQFLKAFYPPEASNDVLFAFIGDPTVLLIGYLAVINVSTFLIFGLDKWKAQRKADRPTTRRIPEKTLFLLSALGGSIGAMAGMRVWRHKTLHASFRYGIPAIFIAQVLLAGVLESLAG